mgnify:CR=1 FL=1
MDWIKCSDKLPEDDERFTNRKAIDVLITTQYKRVRKAQRIYNKYSGIWRWSGKANLPIAWMLLPEPFKEDQ